MSSRDVILGRIRSLLAGGPAAALPPVSEVWPRLQPSVADMAERFTQELTTVAGEVIRCADTDDARAKLAELAAKSGWSQLAAMDRPECRKLVEGPGAPQIAWAQPDWTPTGMADLPASLIVADRLLADTGTSVIACPTAQDRLLCYLPPACVVVGFADRLAEHLPAAWEPIAQRAADPQTRGEFVLITGPSRTSDIEKILILGVHGPKRLIVLLIDRQ